MEKKALVIGIAGLTSSGKSTFSAALEKEIRAKLLVIHTDFYYKEELPRAVSPVTGKEYDDYNSAECIDSERLIRDVRTAATGGEYECVIVEGLCVLSFDGLLELLDLKVFIELDSAERMYRRIRRNMEGMGLSMEEVAEYYLGIAKFQEERSLAPAKLLADVILNGNFIPGKGLALVAGWAQRRLEEAREENGTM